MPATEIDIKHQRLAEFLSRHKLDAVLLRQRNNFAWITAGRDNHIPNSSSVGVASILATADSRLCLTSNIESPRMTEEELFGTGIRTVSFPWYDRAMAGKMLRDVLANRAVAADADHADQFGDAAAALKPLPGDFAQLRWSLTDEEVARYREGGQRASAAMEKACRQLKAGMSEYEVAGILDYQVRAAGCVPTVTLVAADARVAHYRHPIPTAQKVKDYVMLVTCASFAGLISNLTRFVSFRPIPDELVKKHQAVCNIDAAVNLATRPGRTLGEIFSDLQAAYAANDYADEWKNHHQGGSSGYAGREVFASPGNTVTVEQNQAFAWNPSITGTKSEDTVLCTKAGIEILTAASAQWPQVIGRAPQGTLPRPDMLVF